MARDLFLDEIDLRQAFSVFASKDHITAVNGKVAVVDAATIGCLDRIFEHHRVWVAKIESFMRLSDYDGRAAVGGEVHVIRIVDRNVLSWLAGERIDGCDAAVGATLGVVVNPQSF